MKIIYLGLFNNQKNYRIEFQRHTFKFFTGTGWKNAPSEADVLECLKLDVECGSMSFVDFCDNFGYSDDSLSALDIYRACQDTAKKLRFYNFSEVVEE